MNRSGAVATYIAAVVVLFASFGFNAFRVVTPEAIATFAAESDSLVSNAVYATRGAGGAMHGGFMVEVTDSVKAAKAPLYQPVRGLERDAEGRSTYLSQFGLQGVVLSWLAPSDAQSVPRFLDRTRLASALLLAVLLAWCVTTAHRALGRAVAAALLIALACSPWLVVFSRSLYWQAWTAFLPGVAVAMVYRAPNRASLWRATAVAFVAVLVRELIGYEYGTNVVLSCGVGVVIVDALANRPSRDILRRCLQIQIAAAAGLIVAITAHVAKLATLLHSWPLAVGVIRERLVVRSYGASESGFAYFTTGPFRDSMRLHFPWCSTTCQNGAFLGRYLTLPAIELPATRLFIPIGVMVLAVAAFWYAVRPRSGAEPSPEERAWRWGLGVSFVSSVSWVLVMPHHMLNHLHLNAIIFYLPFLPIAYAALARWGLRRWFPPPARVA